MNRPLGVTLLAIAAGAAGIFQIWRILVLLGIADFTFLGQPVNLQEAQWGHAIWAAVIAAIWFWVAAGFWGVRAYAWQFGIFISLFTMVFGFFAILGQSATTESELIGWLLAIGIFFYLNYPGVQKTFMEHELSLLTPEQRAAVEKAQAAALAAQQAMAVPAAPAPAVAAAAPAPAAPAPAPAAPAPAPAADTTDKPPAG